MSDEISMKGDDEKDWQIRVIFNCRFQSARDAVRRIELINDITIDSGQIEQIVPT